jgi:hypothetical protein
MKINHRIVIKVDVAAVILAIAAVVRLFGH